MKEKTRSECVVIGAGIIGLAIAAKLAKQGLAVIVLEAEKKTIQHASRLPVRTPRTPQP